MVSRILILSVIVGVATAATWIGLVPEKPKEFAHKEGCYIEEINDVIPFGKTITPLGHCVRISCSGGLIDYASCGVVNSGDAKCHVTDTDLSKPYPECCPGVACDIDNNLI